MFVQLVGLVSRIQHTAYQYTDLLDLRLSQRDQRSKRTGSVRKRNIHWRSRNYRRDGKSINFKYYIICMCVCVCVCVCVALVILREKRVRRRVQLKCDGTR